MTRLFVSFSGGETSAYMTNMLVNEMAWAWDEIVCLFANTGQENEETLEFVQRCDEAFGLNVVWVEAAPDPRYRKPTRHRVVDFASASREGEPFEAVIRKYGIPNKSYPHCTRELKLNPMRSYLRSIGWAKGTYTTAVGIRADEVDRLSATAARHGIWYPLVQHREVTKPDINAWWATQPFRLNLRGYQGNCRWCWKKSFRKHYTLLWEDPSAYDFPERMEAQYPVAGHNIDGTPRVFFREGTDTRQLREDAAAARGRVPPAEDDSRVYPGGFDPALDASGGCSESCEVDFTEDFE